MKYSFIILDKQTLLERSIEMDVDLSASTAKRLYELRTKHGYTMEKLAELIGVSKGTISKWERGKIANMRRDKVVALAKLYNVQPTYIMGYEMPDIHVSGLDVTISNNVNQTETEERLQRFLNLFHQLDDSEKVVVEKLLESLTDDK